MTSHSHETLASFRKVSVSSNRRFGLTIGAILIVLSILPALLRHHPIRPMLLVLGIAVLVIGMVAPAWLGPVNKLWFRFGLFLGSITNPIVMGVLFFGVLVPIGWILRVRGHDLLRRRFAKDAESYWIHRTADSPQSSLTKQY